MKFSKKIIKFFTFFHFFFLQKNFFAHELFWSAVNNRLPKPPVCAILNV